MILVCAPPDIVGFVPNTTAPVPVSSDKDVANWREVILSKAVPYSVPVVGNVTPVVPVVVNVTALFGVVVKLPPISILPANLIDLAELITSTVTVLFAVNATDEVAATYTSNAAEVSRKLNEVILVCEPPEITGFVLKTTLSDPVVRVTLKVPSLLLVVTIPFVVKLPNFLFVSDSAPANVASVPVTGNVTPVIPVVVNVIALLGVVVKLPPRLTFPASRTVLSLLTRSKVNALLAVNAGDDVAATDTSNAADVSRKLNEVILVYEPPKILGAVSKTNFPVPVEPVDVTPSTVTCPVTLNVPDIVMPSAASVVTTVKIPVLPAESMLNAAASLSRINHF